MQKWLRALGRLLVKRRKDLGLTQDDLASSVGLTRQSISNIEAGKQRLSADRLALILNFLELSWSDLPEITSGSWRDAEARQLRARIDEANRRIKKLEHGR